MSPTTAQTQLEAAIALGVAPTTLAGWKKRGAPIPDRGPIDLSELRKWRKRDGDRRRRRPPERQALLPRDSIADVGADDDEKSVEADKWNTMYRRARAMRAMLAVQRFRRQLVPAEQVTALLGERAAAFEQRLAALADRLPRRLTNKPATAIQRELWQAFRALLAELSSLDGSTTTESVGRTR